MGFYDEMAQVARDLLAPEDRGGLGQGTIELVRYTAAASGPEPWSPPGELSREVWVLDGAASGVASAMIGAPVENGGQVVATDLQVIVAPWGDDYVAGDVLEVDGRAVTVLRMERIPAAGTLCAVRFVVRR